MSETPIPGERTDGGGGRPSGDAPLRRVLGRADAGLLATVVEQFWTERGYETTRSERGGRRFVLVRDADGDPVHVVWVDPTASASPEDVARLARMASSFGDSDATLTTGRDYDAAVYVAAEEHDVECLADEQLVTLVSRAGLRDVVRSHASGGSRANAVADGGATASRTELEPPADHPLAVRAGLVGGGAVLSLLAVWGGAATVTAELQSCTGGCTLLWGASFVPLVAMLLGGFAVAVGLFD
jgi:hypothetical protein